MINTELQKRIDQLNEPNKTILEKLITQLESNTQKEEIRNTIRTNIREYVTKEL